MGKRDRREGERIGREADWLAWIGGGKEEKGRSR